MSKYIFKVVEFHTKDGTIHWKAIDTSNNKEIKFTHNDGLDNMVGQYPSVSRYLKQEYNLNFDCKNSLHKWDLINTKDKNIWIFENVDDKIIIIDIPRTIARIIITH